MAFLFPNGYANPYGDQDAELEDVAVNDQETPGNEPVDDLPDAPTDEPVEDSDRDEPTPEPVDDASVTDPEDQQPEPEEQEDKEQEPIVVLKVRGRDYPIHDKDQLITLAQQGVDYATKMYNMKPWRYLIEAYTKNDEFKSIADKVIRGEDWKEAFAPKQQAQPAPSDAPADDESVEAYIKREVDRRVQEAVTPLKENLTRTQEQEKTRKFLDELRAADPEHFATVYAAMQQIYNTPNLLPDGVRKDIDTNQEAFISFYTTVRERVIPGTPIPEPTKKAPTPQPTPKPEPQRKEQLRQRKTPPPVLEGGRGVVDMVPDKTQKEADAIWEMSDEDFAKYVARNERAYRSDSRSR